MTTNAWEVIAPEQPLQQGEVLFGLDLGSFEDVAPDVIVLTQSCDLYPQNGKPPRAKKVLLIAFSQLGDLSKADIGNWRKNYNGNTPSALLLPNIHNQVSFNLEGMYALNFYELFCVNRTILETHLQRDCSIRYGLQHPYVTNLASHFAHFISRVGLPALPDLPKQA
jgi:hypothetical protein